MRSWTSPDIYRPIGHRNVLLYDGPSQLTGARILVIATAQNGNRKIGHMLQVWIVPSISPIAAVKLGADASVCGDCKLRGDGTGHGRACYVEHWRAVENIWQARAKARVLTPREFSVRHPGLQLRIGAYGDPVAVPLDVWRPLLPQPQGGRHTHISGIAPATNSSGGAWPASIRTRSNTMPRRWAGAPSACTDLVSRCSVTR
jgi:hypothetical protein